MDVADRVVYMHGGKILKDMTLTDFQALPESEILAMGLRCRNLSHVKKTAIAPKTSSNELEVQGISVRLGKQTIFQDLSFTAHGGEVIAVVGKNGVGKTTLARVLCGLQKNDSGTVLLQGKALAEKQRRKCSYMVMQDVNHQLFTEDVLDELLLSMDGEDEKENTERTNQILSSLDLTDKIKLHPMSLSGGEKQRVAIGSAIASNKEILVFDEPTSGLDYFHMVEVSDNLNRLKDMGKSLFLITHDPELIYKCCTYLLFIQENKVLWHRPMDDEAIKLLRAFFSHEKGANIINAS